jgi:quinol monooxygenase YgiN
MQCVELYGSWPIDQGAIAAIRKCERTPACRITGHRRRPGITGENVKSRTPDLIVIASAKAKPGGERALEQALREVAGPTRAQAGCVQFGLYRARGALATIMAVERWASDADHQHHMRALT